MSLDVVYRNILLRRGKAAAGPDTLKEIHKYARVNARRDLFELLAGHPNLDPADDTDLSRHRDVAVTLAWLTRPGRSVEEVAGKLRRDKRTAIALPLARQAGLSPDVYRALGANKSSKVAYALATNLDAPDTVRLEALERYVQHSPHGNADHAAHKIDMACTSGGIAPGDMWQAAARTLVAPYVSASLAGDRERTVDLERWVENLETIAGSGNGRWRHLLPGIVEAIGRRRLGRDTRRELLERATRLHQGENGPDTLWQTLLGVSIRRVENLDVDFRDLLDDFQREHDPARVDDLLVTLLQRDTSDDNLAELVGKAIEHPGVDPARLYRVLGEHRRTIPGPLITRLEARHCHELVDEILDRHYTDTHQPWPVSWLADRDKSIEGYLDRVARSGRLLPDWSVHHLARRRPDALYDQVRWSAIAPVAASKEIADRIWEILVRELGENTQTWETFHALTDDHEGTLEDLLGCANELGT